MFSKTAGLEEGTEVVFVSDETSHLEDYARAYRAAGRSRKETEDLVIGLMWSPLFLGDE